MVLLRLVFKQRHQDNALRLATFFLLAPDIGGQNQVRNESTRQSDSVTQSARLGCHEWTPSCQDDRDRASITGLDSTRLPVTQPVRLSFSPQPSTIARRKPADRRFTTIA